MSDPRRDPLASLRAVDDALARREPAPEAVERVRRRLQARALERPLRERLRWWPALAFAGGAALMAGLLASRPSPPQADAAPRIAAPTSVEDPAMSENAHSVDPPQNAQEGPLAALRTDSDRRGPCRAPTDEPLDLAVGECVEGDGVRIDALAGSALAWTGDEVAVIDGEVLFEVAPRPDRPLRVIAGAASIEVVGTRFVVHHQGRRGWISMLEGRVIADDGRGPSRALEAGERLGWAGPTATTSARATTPARAPRSGDTDGDEGLTELLAEVAELRRRGAYEAAVERLRAGERPTWSRRARALVSYEIGVLLGRQAGDHEAACAHWAEHRRRFADAERDALLLRTLERLGCPP